MIENHLAWRFLGIGVALLLASSPAEAQTIGSGPSGFTISAIGGFNKLRSVDYEGAGIAAQSSQDTGWTLNSALGYQWGQFRSEIELGSRQNDVKSFDGIATGVSGEITSQALMLNGYYQMLPRSRWHPYIGAGAGTVKVNYSALSNGADFRFADSDHVWAVQAMAGLSLSITSHADISVEYRFMGTADPKLETNLGEPFDGAYDSHSIMVGYRIRFGGPRKRIRVAEAPAPKAEPRPTRRLLLNKLKRTPVVPVEEEEEAPLPQKAYLLFFDFDSSKVKGEAVGVVEAAANTALARKASSLTVTGYTDTAGPRPYNKRLSMRRADAVLNALAGWGVSAEDIHTVARGETDLLVSTGDGVREPKNRRVEIVIP